MMRGLVPALEGFTPLVLRSRLSGRSLWVLRYRDGRIVNETQCDWSLAPLGGRQAVRLVCPNGQVAELGTEHGAADGRLFQLKVAYITAGHGRGTLAHLIGLIDGADGACQCAAYEYPEKRLVTFRDCAWAMQYHHLGAVASDHLGLTAP